MLPISECSENIANRSYLENIVNADADFLTKVELKCRIVPGKQIKTHIISYLFFTIKLLLLIFVIFLVLDFESFYSRKHSKNQLSIETSAIQTVLLHNLCCSRHWTHDANSLTLTLSITPSKS